MSETFWDRGYHLIDDLVEPAQLAMMSKAMDVALEKGELGDQSYSTATDALGAYSPVIGEVFLRHARPRIEEIVGRELAEMCAYWRLYRSGSELRRHKDRDACELTISVTIDAPADEAAWPLMVRNKQGEDLAFELPPGAGLLFEGNKVEHWREPLAGSWYKMLFLHYVVKDGEYAEHAFDSRTGDPLIQTVI